MTQLDHKLPGPADTLSAQMEQMVFKYVQNFPVHTPSMATPIDEAILLTGSTGSLGCYLLDALLRQPAVTRVYAFNRPDTRSGRSLEERQLESFAEHGLDDALIRSSKVVLVEGDAASPTLGVDSALFEEMRRTVTCIIHNAWPVNFTIPLASMEPQILQTRSLVDFALRSPHATPPRILFTSSESVFKQWDNSAPAPEQPIFDPVAPQGSGYSESKWIAETVLFTAAERTPIRPIVVRVVQLSGGPSGSWSPTEWFPLMIRFSQLLGCLPRVDGRVSFLPVDVAALALVEMRNSSEKVLHLAHPRPISMLHFLEHFSKVLHLPIVPYMDWLAQVNEPQAHPIVAAVAERVLQFFEMFAGLLPDPAAAVPQSRYPWLEAVTALREAPSLQDIPELGRSNVEEWVAYWRRIGFIPKGKAKL